MGMDGLLGVAGMIDSWPVDHSRTFPAFSTSKSKHQFTGTFAKQWGEITRRNPVSSPQ